MKAESQTAAAEKTEFRTQHPGITNEEKAAFDGEVSDSRSTAKTELSRQFDGIGTDMGVPLHSAWSHEAITRLELSADNALVEVLSAAKAAGHQEQRQEDTDDMAVLKQGTNILNSDAISVAIERINAPNPVQLSQRAILAAKDVTLDILDQAVLDDRHLSGSKCGQDHVKLASTIVCHVLNSAEPGSKATRSQKALMAASLLVEDILHTATTCDAKPDHVWSTDAIKACCRIVREVLDEAAGELSTTNPSPPNQQQQQ